MVLFNYSTKELTAKIVYYGPGLCGKTTNLQYIFGNLPPNIHKGKMLSLATQTDRTLFFDFLPIDLGTIRGMKTRLQLYTVPGQVFYNTTRKLVLKGADGLVFVADSQGKMLEANKESFGNLEENLREHAMDLQQIPHVIQFNKRDLGDVLSAEELNSALNKYNAPIYEAVATTGIGVHETLKAVTRLVLNSLKAKYEGKKGGKQPSAPAAAPSSAPAPPQAASPAPAVSMASPAGPAIEVEEEAALEVEPVLAIEEDAEAAEILEVEPAESFEAVEAVEEIELVEDEPAPLEMEPEEVAAEPLALEPQEIGMPQVEPVEEVLEIEEGLDDAISIEPVPTDEPSADDLGPLSEHMDDEPLAPVSLDPSPLETAPGPVAKAAARVSGSADGATLAVSVATQDAPAVAGAVAVSSTSPGEFTFPVTLEVQGRTVTVRVTISLRIE